MFLGVTNFLKDNQGKLESFLFLKGWKSPMVDQTGTEISPQKYF